jgi:hypothetical protein
MELFNLHDKAEAESQGRWDGLDLKLEKCWYMEDSSVKDDVTESKV